MMMMMMIFICGEGSGGWWVLTADWFWIYINWRWNGARSHAASSPFRRSSLDPVNLAFWWCFFSLFSVFFYYLLVSQISRTSLKSHTNKKTQSRRTSKRFRKWLGLRNVAIVAFVGGCAWPDETCASCKFVA